MTTLHFFINSLAVLAGMVVTGYVGGILGSYAGAKGTDKNWRRIGIPVLLTPIVTLSLCWNYGWIGLLGLITFLKWIPYTMGYGIPTPGDDGSTLGRFFYELLRKDMLAANILTRGVIGLIGALPLLVIPFVTGVWWPLYIAMPMLVAAYIAFGGLIQDEGMFKFKGKMLLWEEYYIYAIDCAATAGVALITLLVLAR